MGWPVEPSPAVTDPSSACMATVRSSLATSMYVPDALQKTGARAPSLSSSTVALSMSMLIASPGVWATVTSICTSPAPSLDPTLEADTDLDVAASPSSRCSRSTPSS